MAHRFIVRPEAESDIDAAYVWYEEQRAGLGAEFLDEVERSLALIQENPELYEPIYSGARRALTRRFPFGVFYAWEEDVISVLAVLHTSRHPDSWKRRV
jgi:plasmid stabilization system protein ParE